MGRCEGPASSLSVSVCRVMSAVSCGFPENERAYGWQVRADVQACVWMPFFWAAPALAGAGCPRGRGGAQGLHSVGDLDPRHRGWLTLPQGCRDGGWNQPCSPSSLCGRTGPWKHRCDRGEGRAATETHTAGRDLSCSHHRITVSMSGDSWWL